MGSTGEGHHGPPHGLRCYVLCELISFISSFVAVLLLNHVFWNHRQCIFLQSIKNIIFISSVFVALGPFFSHLFFLSILVRIEERNIEKE